MFEYCTLQYHFSYIVCYNLVLKKKKKTRFFKGDISNISLQLSKFGKILRELNLMVKYVTFNHCYMSSNLIALIVIMLLK